MSTQDIFLRAILESPADDGPRLVYADWLDEQGEAARAEFIRVQCELEPIRKHGHGSAAPHKGGCITCLKVARLERRERELLDGGDEPFTNRQRWFAPWGIEDRYSDRMRWEFRRGFVAHVSCDLATLFGGPCESCGFSAWARQGGSLSWYQSGTMLGPQAETCPDCSGTGHTSGLAPQLFAAAPIESVRLTDREPHRDEGLYQWVSAESRTDGWLWDVHGLYQWVSAESRTDGWLWDVHRELIPWELFRHLKGFSHERVETAHATAGRYYPTPKAAHAALIAAAVDLGRSRAAGLTHKAKCRDCDGYGCHLGAGPDRGNPDCTTCAGTGHVTRPGLLPLRNPLPAPA